MIYLCRCHDYGHQGKGREFTTEWELGHKYNEQIMHLYDKYDYNEYYNLEYIQGTLPWRIDKISNDPESLAVEIHFNSFPKRSMNGMYALVRNKGSSIALAYHIMANIKSFITIRGESEDAEIRDLGVCIEHKEQRWHGTKKEWTKFKSSKNRTAMLYAGTTVILELGYMTNDDDFNVMQDESWIKSIAFGVLHGLQEYKEWYR